ncbi:related to protein HSE1 [Rhynchosporium agropyri]|uniref:Class E vacuolar protein-sorting machinery protein HSE1 n=1 Tax=Rhynchosporium agropyri TaxID=914238 RepID=A0A1E1LAG5_9HELO|nr:related to protein HSE1 [Rhynchosporium agropyri]
MFRAQQNAFDDVIAKATDENLTSENWEYIMDVCDKVTTEDSGAKDAVAAMIKRLAHRNANVQLYTLELANALSQNCGSKMHRELASRAFTDAMLRLANDRNTHQQVKAKILERMQEWAEMFKDPDLGIMKDQYHKLKSQNPNLHPPSAPQKSRLTDVDRQKEEEELQMALKLSIQDKSPQPQSNKPAQQSGSAGGPSQSQPASQPQTVPSGTTAATVSRVRALFDFHATDPDELTFRKGDVIAVLESVYKDWWKGLLRGQTGIFPLNYVEKLADPTSDELQREAQMEAEVFAEIKNVEKLLTLLSTSSSDLNVKDNEEITKLYHSTLAIRPKLIELIGKYSQRKDDFTQLNERFIKSCRDYENLLDASMTQAQPAYQYGRHQQGYGGGYPPQAAPPQQDTQRYYTPNQPTEQPYPPQTTSPQGYPPQPLRSGPAPFYVVAQQQQQQLPQEPQPGQVQHQYPQRDPPARIPSNPMPAPLQTSSPPPNQYPQPHAQSGHRPQSTYSNPQELATSVYDSPVGQQPNSAYSASLYSQEDPYSAGAPSNAQPLPAQQQYNAYAPPQQQYPPQSQPSYDAPPPPNASAPPPLTGDMNSGYPNIGQPLDARQTLPSQGTPSQSQYKPYQRPGSAEGHMAAPSASPGGPADFYRQSAAY